MNSKRKTFFPAVGFLIAAGLGLQACSPKTSGTLNGTSKSDTTRSIAPYFTPATSK
jgi:hypothetical protein